MELERVLASGVAAALVSTMCLAADAPAVPVPTSPGADYGDNEGQRISYGIAFNTPIAKASAAQAPAKKR